MKSSLSMEGISTCMCMYVLTLAYSYQQGLYSYGNKDPERIWTTEYNETWFVTTFLSELSHKENHLLSIKLTKILLKFPYQCLKCCCSVHLIQAILLAKYN